MRNSYFYTCSHAWPLVTRFIKALFIKALFTPYLGASHTYSQVWQLVRKIRSLELFASGKSRGVGKRRIQDQGALSEQRRAAPRRRNGVSMDAGATESAPLTTMLGGGSTAEQSLDRHTMALAQCVLMFLLLFFHAMSVAAAQV